MRRAAGLYLPLYQDPILDHLGGHSGQEVQGGAGSRGIPINDAAGARLEPMSDTRMSQVMLHALMSPRTALA